MGNKITELHKVTVEAGENRIEFVAEPHEGRLVTREVKGEIRRFVP
jgi:hypothetical protein